MKQESECTRSVTTGQNVAKSDARKLRRGVRELQREWRRDIVGTGKEWADHLWTGGEYRFCNGTHICNPPTTTMKTLRDAGERQTQSSVQSVRYTDIPIASASRLRMRSTRDDVQHGGVDDISKQFTGAGWKNMPQELVDEILGHLMDDLGALKACSLTCKHLFGATRPLIHQRLRLVLRPNPTTYPKPKRSLFSRRESAPEAPEWLVNADRSGLLRYTRLLTLEFECDYLDPRNMEGYLPHLRSITELHTLALITFHIHLSIPVFNKCFGKFTDTLRHLDIWIAHGTERQLLYIICQFPRLEDLTIMSPVETVANTRHPVPTITRSPPLGGKLFLAQAYSRELFTGLAALPGGLNFRSLELIWCQCVDLQVILAASSHTATSISYMWYTPSDEYGESNSHISCVCCGNRWGL